MKRKAEAFCLAALLILTLSGSVWAAGFFTFWQSPEQFVHLEKQLEKGERLPAANPFLDSYFSGLQVEAWQVHDTYAPLGKVVGRNDTTAPETLVYRQKETVTTKGQWTALLDDAALRGQVRQWIAEERKLAAEDQVTFSAREGELGTLFLSPGMAGVISGWQSALEVRGSFLLQLADEEGTVYEARRVPFTGIFPLVGFHLENRTE